MKVLFISLLLSGLVAGRGLESLLDLCANPPKTPQISLSDKISLPEQYKISGSVTDWKNSVTALLQESSTKDYRVLLRQSHDQIAERWVQSLTGEQQIIFVNVTNGSCNTHAPKAELFRVARFDSIIGNDTSSLHRIIQGVIEFAKTHQGFVLDDHVEVVGGVNVKKWISCVDGTNETKVILEVRFAGEDTMRPALAQFSNPLALSVRLAELQTFNSTLADNHVSVELDRYELPVGNEANIEHGIICDDMSGTQIQLKPLDEYAASLDYYDYIHNRSQIVDVLYSKTRQVFIIAGNNFDYGVRLIKKKEYLNGTDYVLHDFKYGYEFTMSQGACKKFSPLTDGTADVVPQQSNLTMQSMEKILVDMELRWYAHQVETDLSGIKYKTFRAFDSEEGLVIELDLTEDGEVRSMTSYRNRQLAHTLTVSRKPVEASRLNQREPQLSDCYDDGKFDNGTLIMQIKDKKLSDLKKVGLHRLNDAVVASISKNVNPIIPYRVAIFWVDNTDGGLSVVLRIAEKTELQPGPVGYNLTSEIPTVEIFKLMNSTMFLEKMPFEVKTVDGVTEQWVPDANTVKAFPDNNTGFVGYTGGAMFVLTIFCLVIGVAIGAVGVFVATRRQRISTLAYQVFE